MADHDFFTGGPIHMGSGGPRHAGELSEKFFGTDWTQFTGKFLEISEAVFAARAAVNTLPNTQSLPEGLGEICKETLPNLISEFIDELRSLKRWTLSGGGKNKARSK